MTELMNKKAVELLLLNADVIAYASSTVTYYGFCEPKDTTGTDSATWAICRVTKSGASVPYTETREWVNGQQTRTSVFDDRATLSYSLRKF